MKNLTECRRNGRASSGFTFDSFWENVAAACSDSAEALKNVTSSMRINSLRCRIETREESKKHRDYLHFTQEEMDRYLGPDHGSGKDW